MARSGLLPTPTASDHQNRGRRAHDGKRGTSLTDTVRGGLLPTPTAADANGSRNATSGRRPGSQHNTGTTLTDALWLGMLPTPRARDWKGDGKDCLPSSLGVGGSLHPRFVEWMQGFPPGWTELDDDDQ
jgi:hypothetical protein